MYLRNTQRILQGHVGTPKFPLAASAELKACPWRTKIPPFSAPVEARGPVGISLKNGEEVFFVGLYWDIQNGGLYWDYIGIYWDCEVLLFRTPQGISPPKEGVVGCTSKLSGFFVGLRMYFKSHKSQVDRNHE